MARFYELPIWGNAGMSDSRALDEQAAIDAAFSIQVALLTGTHLAHDVGYLEAGLTTSPEMIVLSAEIISMMDVFAGGMRLDAESLALEVIQRWGRAAATWLTSTRCTISVRSGSRPCSTGGGQRTGSNGAG